MDGQSEYNEVQQIIERVTRDTEIREETNAGIRDILRIQRELFDYFKSLDRRQGIILGMMATIQEGMRGIARQIGYEWEEGKRALSQIDEENRRRLMEPPRQIEFRAERDIKIEGSAVSADEIGGNKDED